MKLLPGILLVLLHGHWVHSQSVSLSLPLPIPSPRFPFPHHAARAPFHNFVSESHHCCCVAVLFIHNTSQDSPHLLRQLMSCIVAAATRNRTTCFLSGVYNYIPQYRPTPNVLMCYHRLSEHTRCIALIFLHYFWRHEIGNSQMQDFAFFGGQSGNM